MYVEIRINKRGCEPVNIPSKIPEPFSISIGLFDQLMITNVLHRPSSPYIPLGATIVFSPKMCFAVPAISSKALVLPDVIGAGSKLLSPDTDSEI